MCRFALAAALALGGCAAVSPTSPDSVKSDLSVAGGDNSTDFGEQIISNDDMATPPRPGDDLRRPPLVDMANPSAPPVDMATLPCPVAQHLVINEVKANGASDPSDEFVEIYNPCSVKPSVAIGGFKLMHRSATGSSDTPTITIPAGKTIAANGYFIIVGPTYSGKQAFDVQYSGAMLSGTGGGLALKNGSTIIDSMGWGTTATNAYVVGKPAPAAPDGQSMARTPNGSSANGSNALDFQVAATPTPRLQN